MASIISREYQTLLVIERWLARVFGRAVRGLKVRRLFSPWFLFWITIGGFFFAFQAYLLVHSLTLPFAEQVELVALAAGAVIGVVIGLIIIAFFDNHQTDWRLPMAIFGLWMIAPTIFPFLFLVGIFSGEPKLITLQTADSRPILEFLIFGMGILLIGFFYKKITFTQGAVTVLLFSFFFIGKLLITNSFYLSGRCPLEVTGDSRAWESNSRAEIEAYRAASRDDDFYRSPVGQLVCTRTQENLFR